MINAKRLVVLFFISGPVPTDAQRSEASDMISGKVEVKFRNALHVGAGDCLEKCDAVAGDVPARYNEFPRLSDLLEPVSISGKPQKESTEAHEGETEEMQTLRETREKNDAGAKAAKVDELKQALSDLGIAYEPNAKKADLLALYLNRP